MHVRPRLFGKARLKALHAPPERSTGIWWHVSWQVESAFAHTAGRTTDASARTILDIMGARDGKIVMVSDHFLVPNVVFHLVSPNLEEELTSSQKGETERLQKCLFHTDFHDSKKCLPRTTTTPRDCKQAALTEEVVAVCSNRQMASRRGASSFLTAGLPFVTFIVGGSYMLSEVGPVYRRLCCLQQGL